MKDTDKSYEELIAEISQLRARLQEKDLIEEEMAKRHEKMLSVFEAIDEMIYVSDPDTYELLFVNNCVKKEFDIDIIGKKCYQIFHNKNSPCSFCTNNMITGENLGNNYIWEIQNSYNGRFYRCIDKAIDWPDGRMVRFEMAIDISNSKIAEIKLKESEKKFEAMSTFAKDAIIAIDNSGKINFWNRAAEELLGYTFAEANNKNVHSLIAPEQYREQYDIAFTAFKKTGKGDAIGKTVKLTAKKKGGSEIEVELSLSAIKLNDSWNAVAILRDITTKEMLKKKLLQAKIDAEKANRTKSEFLANMSHELRTPLNSVIGFSDTLLEGYFGKLNEKQIHYLKNISGSGKHLLEIINTILDISKIESGTMVLHMDTFDIKDQIQEMVSLMQPLALKKEITISIVPEHNESKIKADQAKVKQILYNLLGNAIKFTDSNGSIIIETRNENNYIVISVIDTGIGIDPRDQDKLFKPFVQIDSNTARQYEGTGLGLALVKELVELHDGEVRVESEPGKGTNFTFSLPL